MKKFLILLMVVLFSVMSQAAWDVEYNLGSGGSGGLVANGFSLTMWGGPLVETVMSDHVVVDGSANPSYPGGYFVKQDLGIGLNRSGPWTFQMTFSTPGNQVRVSPTMGGNWLMVNGGPYDQTANKISSYAEGINIAPIGFDSTLIHTYTVAKETNVSGPAAVYLDGVLIGNLAWGSGAISDGMDFYCGVAASDVVNIYSMKFAASYIPESAMVIPLTVSGDKQLFIDGIFFDRKEGIRLTLHPAHKTGEKNLESDKLWENASLNWFSFMEDQGKYRMWYEAYDIDSWDCTGCDTSFCYAESTDGITWTKPSLGLYKYKDSADNNILFREIGPEGAHSRVHGTCVFKDPSGPRESRYKAVSQGIFSTVNYRTAGMYSADGLRWTRYAQPIINEFADSQYSGFWDSQIGKYVVYGRSNNWDRGRSIGRSESNDFSGFSPLTLVLQVNDKDPAESDIYNPAALKYPYAANAYFMFYSLFQHGPQTLDIRLAVSRDGINWTRPDQTVPFIPLGSAGTFDSGSLYMGQGVLRVGEELWQYYGGSPLTHAQGERPEELAASGNGRIYSRVISRLDGYVSADANSEGGYFITPPLQFKGNVLSLNVNVRSGGSVRVGLLDENGNPIPGRSVQDCEIITGDHISKMVMWGSDGNVASRADKPTRMKVEMKNAELYAFQFCKGYPYVVK